MAISGDVYKRVGRASAGAVSVVTAFDKEGTAVVALTVSSFVTLSFDPPLVMFAIQTNANSYPSMIESSAFGVSLLASTQAAIAQRFAGKEPSKTVGVAFDRGETLAVPLVPGSLAQIECLTREIFLSGDHAIIVGLVEAARTSEGLPLLYFERQYGSFKPL